MKRIEIFFLALIPTLCHAVTFAQTPDSLPPLKSPERHISIYTEEDVYPILLVRKLALDQNYTMGFGFSWSTRNGAFFDNARKFVTGVMSTIVGKPNQEIDQVRVVKKLTATNPTLSVNGAAFTPDSLEKYDISYRDRPYSFLLTIGSGVTVYKKDFRAANTYKLNIGVYGLRLGQFIQTQIHKGQNDGDTHNPRTPRGWPHQIGDGLKATFMYSFRQDILLTKRNLNPEVMAKRNSRSNIEFSYAYEILLGYYTGVCGEFNGRIGLLDSRNWLYKFNQLSDADKGNSQISDIKNRFYSGERKFEAFLYFNVRPGIILFNEGLSSRAADYRLKPLLEANPFVGEFSAGLGFNIPLNCTHTKMFSLGFTPFALRTPEMWGGKISRTHYWGGIFLKLVY